MACSISNCWESLAECISNMFSYFEKNFNRRGVVILYFGPNDPYNFPNCSMYISKVWVVVYQNVCNYIYITFLMSLNYLHTLIALFNYFSLISVSKITLIQFLHV